MISNDPKIDTVANNHTLSYGKARVVSFLSEIRENAVSTLPTNFNISYCYNPL
jgi:hypothetical protein